eukprot:10087707-Karenia_brevis.AAC.1
MEAVVILATTCFDCCPRCPKHVKLDAVGKLVCRFQWPDDKTRARHNAQQNPRIPESASSSSSSSSSSPSSSSSYSAPASSS